MIINLIAEGQTEEIIAARLLPFCGHELGTVYGRKGCAYIRQKAAIFSHLATEQSGVLVLTDFRDANSICITAALQEYILNKQPKPPETFLCCFAVNELESWLLADREGLANFLGIAVSLVPLQPESEEFPKKTLLDLASTSRKRKIREGIAPRSGHHAAVGPDYMNLMSEFVFSLWNIESAMRYAPSLERCVRRLQELS
jgi:hypothetical protein